NSYRLMIRTYLLDFAATLTRTFHILDTSPLLDRGQYSRRFTVLKDYMEANYPEKILVADLASMVNMSPTHFTRTFKAVFGKPPLDYLLQVRIRHAAQQILAGDRRVIDIAQDCGFPSISHFIACFRRITGVPPHLYRKQQVPDIP
ncbi:MAG TPA: AraC family transcriptional regulator, partial [Spirochaetia bacterium]|nr:AraC family transcriptional regulator [Spirochaetia bacterium]